MRDIFPGEKLQPYKLGDDCIVQDCGCIIETNHKDPKTGLYSSKLFQCPEHTHQ